MKPISPETIFRMTFGLIWLVYFGVRFYYQRRSKSGLMMLERFGEPYREYMQRTGRL